MKKVLVILIVLMLTVALSGIALAQETSAPSATATLRDKSGTVVGTATFTEETEAGVHVVVKLNGNLKVTGAHGLHIHEVGTCSPDFKAAGEHFNPIGRSHGKHAGDLPNLIIQADGTADYDVWSTGFTLTEGGLSIFDFNGSALLIHSNADDMTSKPAGDSGEPLACGVITGLNGLGTSGGLTNTTGTLTSTRTLTDTLGTSTAGTTGTLTSTNTLTGTTGTVTSTGTMTSTAGVTDTTDAPTTLPVTGSETDAGFLIAILALGAALLAGGYMLRRSASQTQ